MNSIRAADRTVDAPLNIDELSDRCLGRLDLVERVLQRFHQAMDQDLEQLEQALRAADLKAVAGIAHRVKGTSSTIAAHELKGCAERLEADAQTDCFDRVEKGVAVLHEEWVRLGQMLTARSSRTHQ